ncbi:O-antigen polymerase [Leuconostoc mesenteroides]|nr:O-antigen polymerase [Leuconostoc mesenteroides]MDG9751017.1 O-antigen ligase [Leuconostoc mesenteroides]GEP16439.1 hypothetical protein LME05_11750 [Leuconostoc mesenteroides subsp. cremoris]
MDTRFLLEIIIISIIIIILFINKKLNNSIFSPPIFFFLNITINLLLGISLIDFSYNILGVIYLVMLAVLVFAMTAPLLKLLQKNGVSNELRQKSVSEFSYKKSKLFVIIITGLAILSPFYSVFKNGIHIQDLLNFQELISYNSTVAQNRYSGGNNTGGAINSLLLVFLYAAPMVGGTHRGLFKEEKISYITFFPSILTVILTNTKAGMIASVVVFLAGWIIGQTVQHRQPKVDFKNFIFTIFFAVVLVIFLLFAMLLRIGDFSSYMLTSIWDKFMMYAFGDVPAFNSWLTNFQAVSYGFGKNTFIGIFNLLGLSERVQGLYTDVVYLPKTGLVTNVFSAYRALNMDFSWYGSMIFILFFCFIATICFSRVSHGGLLTISGFILMNFYFFTMYAKFTSIWTYSSYIFALCLYGMYLIIIKTKKRSWVN